MLYMKQRLRKYGIESAVTFGKSRSRSHVREKWHKIGFFAHVQVDFVTIQAQTSFFIEYLCISPQSLSAEIFLSTR